MLNKILHTLGSRAITMLLSLAMLFITTRWMGAENKGEISLLVLNLSVASILSGLFGGPSLVYLTPRFKFSNLLFLNYSWAFITSICLTALLYFTSLPLNISSWSFAGMAILESLIAANLMFILGKEHIKQHNLIQIAKVAITVITLIYLNTISIVNFDSFVVGYSLSLLITFGLSFALIFKHSNKKGPGFITTAKSAFKYGFLVQTGNVSQLLNYRLSYYLLELLISPPHLALIRIGIFHTAVQMAEALWQFARSISTVQYATVSNLSDQHEGLKISILLAKLNYVATAFGLLALLLFPNDFYIFLFGEEFSEVKHHLWWLSIGIFFLSISNAFSHYFAGIGKHQYNTYSSVFGLILTATIAYPAISYAGTIGAAITASIVYTLQTIYQYWFLYKDHKVLPTHLVLNKSDIDKLREQLPF